MTATSRLLRRPDDADPAALSATAADRRIDDAAIRLGRTEQWMLETVDRRGTIGFVATVTVAIALVSVGLTVGAMALVFGLDDEALGFAMVIALGVPSLVAPPTLYVTIRLADRLDTAGKFLRRAALTDPLTGVLNRRGFFDAVDDFGRLGDNVEVVMADVDRFKQLNDLHGHATGDRVLKLVADWIVAFVGEVGVVARMGGDEFAFVVPACHETLPSRQSLVMDGISLSVSFGSANFTAGADFDDALANADVSLYGVKRVSNHDST